MLILSFKYLCIYTFPLGAIPVLCINISQWLQGGYRHIDTAWEYGVHESVCISFSPNTMKVVNLVFLV